MLTTYFGLKVIIQQVLFLLNLTNRLLNLVIMKFPDPRWHSIAVVTHGPSFKMFS